MDQPKKTGPHRFSLNLGEFRPPAGYRPGSGHQAHDASFTSTRTAVHRGRTIKVETTYRIEIDGEPLTLHTTVLDDGSVHCHGLPNYSFPSAIELARSIIDVSSLAYTNVDQIGNEGLHQGGDHHGSHNGNEEADC